MFYDRKIKYLDYYENGERIRGAGFLKLEVRDGSLRVELSVTGLHPTDTFEREILLYGEGKEGVLGRVMISGGRGEFRQSYRDLEQVGGTGIGYGEARGLRIPLGIAREIVCSWREHGADKAGKAGESKGERKRSAVEDGKGRRATDEGGSVAGRGIARDDEKGAVRRTMEGDGRERRAAEEGGKATGRRTAEGNEREGRAAEEGGKATGRQTAEGNERERRAAEEGGKATGRRTAEGNERERRTAEEGWMAIGSTAEEGKKGADLETAESDGKGTWRRAAEEDKKELWRGAADDGKRTGRMGERESGGRAAGGERPFQLMEDKWQQLYAIYPHIRPFGDDREYISVRPADFVIFASESYKAANNSFLLHGYYNYKHLILTRAEKKGELRYYIGVPGNFYEREKQVAIMFGFESFECAEEPAQAGDFGYYMMRTEL